MRPSYAFLGTLVLISSLLLLVYGIAALSPVNPTRDASDDAGPLSLPPLERPTVSFGNHYLGPRDAKVSIIVFGDYLCQPCAEFEASLNQALQEFEGKIRVVWKDMPNERLHGESVNAAIAARCAGDQGAFWEYHRALMADQASISLNNYAVFALALGLDAESFQDCMDTKRTQPLVQRDYDEGQRLRIDGTPYTFIGDRRISGAISYDQLRTFIESAIATEEVRAQSGN